MAKSQSEFNSNKARKDGLQNKCRLCQREFDKSYYKEKPARRRQLREKNKKVRKKILDWYRNYKQGLECLCGEDHPACLDFHHRNPDEKEAEVSTLVGTSGSINRILKEIAKCDVVCSNCHRKKHWNGD